MGSFTPNQIQTWRAIKQAQAEFFEKYLVPDVSESEAQHAFTLWIASDYGIKLVLTEFGYSNYEIIDPEKHLLFVLKFVK